MARSLRIPPYLTLDEVEQRYRRANDVVARSQWHILWLLAGGMTTSELARVIIYSMTWLREATRRYREGGSAGVGDRRHGNPGAAPLLDTAQQAGLRQVVGGPAPDGGLWPCRQVAVWIGTALGRPVDPARGSEWLPRLGCTPQRPRPQDPGRAAGASGLQTLKTGARS